VDKFKLELRFLLNLKVNVAYCLKDKEKLKPPISVPVEVLIEEPYASIVCYPRSNPSEMQQRIEELRQHGVLAIEFVGKTSASNIPVLGKGYVGVVAAAILDGQRVALKMRRIDADRESLEHEAKLLMKANEIGVGPKFLAVSKNFLLMQLIDGDLLEDWLETNKDKQIIRKVLVDILEQCWRLDELRLDHGEISKAPKHLIVDKDNKPFIVDFETASLERKVINVTSVCQFLFMGNSRAAKMLGEVFGEKNKAELIAALKKFKKNQNRGKFEDLLELCLS
jgi:putative serine/threonine protein kinase